MVMLTFALRAVFATEVAVIVTVVPFGIAGGAVNTVAVPLVVASGLNENAPHATDGWQAQVTPALLWSCATVAIRLAVAPTARVVGVVVIVTARGPPPPQPATPKAHTESRTIQRVPRLIAALLPLPASRFHCVLRVRSGNHFRCGGRIGDRLPEPSE